jgi:hypothetical protein
VNLSCQRTFTAKYDEQFLLAIFRFWLTVSINIPPFKLFWRQNTPCLVRRVVLPGGRKLYFWFFEVGAGTKAGLEMMLNKIKQFY